eukprot:6204173-Pleurochrysis_carterae.AAC.2
MTRWRRSRSGLCAARITVPSRATRGSAGLDWMRMQEWVQRTEQMSLSSHSQDSARIGGSLSPGRRRGHGACACRQAARPERLRARVVPEFKRVRAGAVQVHSREDAEN